VTPREAVAASPARRSLDAFAGFRSPELARGLLERIRRQIEALAPSNPLRLMEVCGTHTVAIARAGLRSVLPKGIELISGPGCPVCVSANRDIDQAIALTRLPQVTLATFGDMMRVPGSSTSLQRLHAQGASIEIVYSPLDALRLAQACDNREVVFVGVGFETTTPLVAATIERAQAMGLRSFSVLAIHKTVPPALRALAGDAEVKIDALILPGHVSTILGVAPYKFLAEDFGMPGCVTGFEPVDILSGISSLLEQLAAMRGGAPAAIANAYPRAVMEDGNPVARAATDKVFEPVDATWRGIGMIPGSGCAIREPFSDYDASLRFADFLASETEPTAEPRGCRCGEVLRGVLAPDACALFGRACTPESPVGPCMVSSEGSCAAWHRYDIRS
jgi:hydrogenase expression/formation protein HypD